MKKSTRIISLVLSLTMIITTMLTNCAFAAITFNDVNESTAYRDAIYNLVADGVLNGYDNEDGSKSFKPENNITRAEFAKVIVVAKYGSNVLANATTSKFTDMAGNWAIPYVTYANGAGIINGYEDGTFRPANPVTYAEAVKMIVCALGYGPVVDTTTTPWYQGYINVANSIGLTNGAVGLAETPAVRGLVAQLVDNMGDCKSLVQSGVNADGTPIYSVSDGSEITGVDTYEDTGVLISVYDNSIKGTDSELNKSKINIDEKIFELESSVNYLDLEQYLGQAVTYKWYTKSGRDYITSVRSANSTSVYTVDSTLIDSFDGSRLYYYESEDADDTDYYTLDSNLYVIYNGYGVEKSDITTVNLDKWLDIDTGSVALYNNDGDKDIDVINIEKYDTYYVQQPVTSKGITTIKDQIDPKRTIAIDSEYAVVTQVSSKGGKETTAKLTSIKKDNIVSVAAPLNPVDKKIIVKISSATESGVISTMGNDYDDVMIGNKKYEFTDYFRALIAKDASKYGFDLGANVKFYLDFAGRVVFAGVTVAEVPYAYLIDYATSSSMDDEGVTLRIVDESNKRVPYELKSKVKINGVSYDESEAIDQLAKSAARIESAKAGEYKASAAGGKKVISQLIKYKKGTEDGATVIEELFTVSATATSSDTEDGGIVPVWTTADGSSAPFISGNNKIACQGTSTTKQFKVGSSTQFAVGSKTIVFRIPKGRTDVDGHTRTTGSSSFSDGSKYIVEAYDIDGTTANVVVYYLANDGSSKVYANTNAYLVVGNIIGVQNDDGKDVEQLEYIKIGDRVYDENDPEKKLSKTVLSKDLTQLDGIKKGDVVRFVSSAGEIEVIEKLFTYADTTLYGKASTDDEIEEYKDNYFAHAYNSSKPEYFQAHFGKVYTKDIEDDGAGTITIYKDGVQDDYEMYYLTSDTWYYTVDGGSVVDSGHGLITDGHSSDYDSATEVLVISYDEEVRGIYIMTEN